jgi:HSP20 family protein
LIYADLPGVKKEDVHLSYEEGTVKLEATFGPRTYKRVFETQLALDAERIGAELKHGVLTLRLPKRQRQARAIQVS